MYNSALIHISDIECGPKNRAAPGNVPIHVNDPYITCAKQLVNDIRKVVPEDIVNNNRIGLIISGDCANKGKEEEFKQCKKIVRYIQNELSIPRELTAAVPGNHDVDWDACKNAYFEKYPSASDHDDRSLWKRACVLPEKLQNYGRLLFQPVCDKQHCFGEPVHFESFKHLGIALVGLDSTHPITFCREDNYGLLMDVQLEKATHMLTSIRNSYSQLIPIVIVHHSLDTIKQSDQDVEGHNFLRCSDNARAVLKEAGFALVLCGHLHQTRQETDFTGALKISTVGSYGLSEDGLKQRYKRAEPNKYQIILLKQDGHALFKYRKLDAHKGTSGTGEWEDDTGRDNPEEEISLVVANTHKNTDISVDRSEIDFVASEPKKTGIGEGCVVSIMARTYGAATKISNVRYSYEVVPNGKKKVLSGDPSSNYAVLIPARASQVLRVSCVATTKDGKQMVSEMQIDCMGDT